MLFQATQLVVTCYAAQETNSGDLLPECQSSGFPDLFGQLIPVTRVHACHITALRRKTQWRERSVPAVSPEGGPMCCGHCANPRLDQGWVQGCPMREWLVHILIQQVLLSLRLGCFMNKEIDTLQKRDCLSVRPELRDRKESTANDI